MATPAPAPYTIRTETEGSAFTGSAEDIHSALAAAWQLNRHTEETVVIVDNRDPETGPRPVARLLVEWLDG